MCSAQASNTPTPSCVQYDGSIIYIYIRTVRYLGTFHKVNFFSKDTRRIPYNWCTLLILPRGGNTLRIHVGGGGGEGYKLQAGLTLVSGV